MFGNECVGDLGYEAVPALILMAGMLVSFMVEYVSYRLIQRQNKKAIINLLEASTNKGSQELLSVLIMEAGVNFHSICESQCHILFYEKRSDCARKK